MNCLMKQFNNVTDNYDTNGGDERIFNIVCAILKFEEQMCHS